MNHTCLSVVDWGNTPHVRKSRVRFPTRSLHFCSARKCFWGLKRDRCERPTASSSSVSWLASKCGNLDVSQSYGRPWLVTLPAMSQIVLYLRTVWSPPVPHQYQPVFQPTEESSRQLWNCVTVLRYETNSTRMCYKWPLTNSDYIEVRKNIKSIS